MGKTTLGERFFAKTFCQPRAVPREKITIRFVFLIVAKAAARAACDRAQLPQKESDADS